MGECLENWGAAMRLPLVMGGLSQDPWHPFRDYAIADRGRKSTFFLVPFKNHAGVAPDGTTVASRAVAYEANDIKADVQDVARTHAEVAVHGLDAWRNPEAGRQEKLAVAKVSAHEPAGVTDALVVFLRRFAKTHRGRGVRLRLDMRL